MKVKYRQSMRKEIAIAVLAVHESNCILSEVAGHRVWFSPDTQIRNISIQCCFDGSWTVTWSGLRYAPNHKTYEELLKYLKRLVNEFKG